MTPRILSPVSRRSPVLPATGPEVKAARDAYVKARRERDEAQDALTKAARAAQAAEERCMDAAEAYQRACSGYAMEKA